MPPFHMELFSPLLSWAFAATLLWQAREQCLAVLSRPFGTRNGFEHSSQFSQLSCLFLPAMVPSAVQRREQKRDLSFM